MVQLEDLLTLKEAEKRGYGDKYNLKLACARYFKSNTIFGLKCVKIANRWLVTEEDLKNYIKNKKTHRVIKK
jgi:hypothetical protein